MIDAVATRVYLLTTPTYIYTPLVAAYQEGGSTCVHGSAGGHEGDIAAVAY